MRTATIIVPTLGAPQLGELLASLSGRPSWAELIVVDNGSGRAREAVLAAGDTNARVIELERNAGFSRAVNLAAHEASGDALVLVNDDCVCDPGFVEAITTPLDPGRGVTMVAGVMRDRADPTLIDTAGIELDAGLVGQDYLTGEPLERLASVADPIGPSGAAAAYDRATFLELGGFDENLFAYWEDVDLALRMRLAGGRCVLARAALGTHEHSATHGSGSAEKNYLMGFGRGYLARKWGVLRSPSRLARALATDTVICAGQLVLDRNIGGIRGRIRGLAAGRRFAHFPAAELEGLLVPGGPARTLGRHGRRRFRLRARPLAGGEHRALVVLHAGGETGPLESLRGELGWLAGRGPLHVAMPGGDPTVDWLDDIATVHELEISPATTPRGPRGIVAAGRQLTGEVRRLRELIEDVNPDIVLVVTSMLPAAFLAARRERRPTLAYIAEIHAGAGPLRRAGGRALLALASRSSDAVIACSEAVARRFSRRARGEVAVVEPPVSARYADGDGAAFREGNGIEAGDRVILAVGNLSRGRGQDLLIRALPRIRQAVPGARLVLVGRTFPRAKDQAYEATLRALVRERGLEAEVTIAGEVADIASAYAAADLLVNPVRVAESFGRAACEALVAGVPVVSARVGAVPEVLAGLPGVAFVSPGNVRALAAAVIDVLGSEEAIAQAREAGPIVLERYSEERSLAAFKEIVERLLQRLSV
jgi:GT2 family glycosyltransferase